MSERVEKIKELYYLSNSVQFGEFRFSVHEDHPDLPLSPNKLHYPQPGEPGSEYLPELFHEIGNKLYEICESQEPAIRPTKIAAVPRGAVPVADALAKHYPGYPDNLLEYFKTSINGKRAFLGPGGKYQAGDEVWQVDDHTSTGRNALLFRSVQMTRGFRVPILLSVVDRLQGGTERIQAAGAKLLSITTIDEVLDFGFEQHYRTEDEVEAAKAYNKLLVELLAQRAA